MDNESLNDLLLNANQKQFWFVLWGDPDRDPFTETMNFDEAVIEQSFPIHPVAITPGAILFVHRIRFSNIMFVAETITSARHATSIELTANPSRARWPWSIDARILTSTLGTTWREIDLKSFALAREYNELKPEDRITLGRLNFGAPARISVGFATFLLDRILRIS